MTFTTYGREQIAYRIGSQTSNYVRYFGAGTGSKVESNSNGLLGSDWARFEITGSPFFESRKVTFTGDLNSIQSSGLILTEFGLFSESGTIVGNRAIGSTWTRNALAGSIVCDGTIELKFEEAIEVM